MADADHENPEEEKFETTGEPILHEVKMQTGTEDEDVLWEAPRAKVYKFVADEKQWRERGVGPVKILQHRVSKKIRLLVRREGVHKICVNHFILPGMSLEPGLGSDKAWVWTTHADVADGTPAPATLAIKFTTAESAAAFKTEFNRALEAGPAGLTPAPAGAAASAPAAAGESKAADAKGEEAKGGDAKAAEAKPAEEKK